MFSKKKKLTKKQVVDTILKMGSLNAKLFTDRVNHSIDSKVPMTPNKLLDLDKILANALKRAKNK